MEPPGTAPGSEPLITREFIAIVPRNRVYIGAKYEREKKATRSYLVNSTGLFSNHAESVQLVAVQVAEITGVKTAAA